MHNTGFICGSSTTTTGRNEGGRIEQQQQQQQEQQPQTTASSISRKLQPHPKPKQGTGHQTVSAFQITAASSTPLLKIHLQSKLQLARETCMTSRTKSVSVCVCLCLRLRLCAPINNMNTGDAEIKTHRSIVGGANPALTSI